MQTCIPFGTLIGYPLRFGTSYSSCLRGDHLNTRPSVLDLTTGPATAHSSVAHMCARTPQDIYCISKIAASAAVDEEEDRVKPTRPLWHQASERAATQGGKDVRIMCALRKGRSQTITTLSLAPTCLPACMPGTCSECGDSSSALGRIVDVGPPKGGKNLFRQVHPEKGETPSSLPPLRRKCVKKF